MDNPKTSRHAAATPSDCEKMAKKYRWKLKGVERNGNNLLPVDCIFDGETTFPESFIEVDEDDHDHG